MATTIRSFSAVTEVDPGGSPQAAVWQLVGVASLAAGLAPTSGTSAYIKAPLSDSGALFTNRLKCATPAGTGGGTSPGTNIPLFASVTAYKTEITAKQDVQAVPVTEEVDFGSTGDAVDGRGYNASPKNDSWDTAGILIDGVTSAPDGTWTGYSHTPYSNRANYVGNGTGTAHAGRLNAGYVLEFGGVYTVGIGGTGFLYFYGLTDTVTWTAPAAPAAFTLAAPADTATAVSLTPTISWNASTRAVLFRVQVATDSGFTSLVVDTTTTPITSEDQTAGLTYTIPAGILLPNTLYYVRVTARNYAAPDSATAQNTPCTADFSFTTINPSKKKRRFLFLKNSRRGGGGSAPKSR